MEEWFFRAAPPQAEPIFDYSYFVVEQVRFGALRFESGGHRLRAINFPALWTHVQIDPLLRDLGWPGLVYCMVMAGK